MAVHAGACAVCPGGPRPPKGACRPLPPHPPGPAPSPSRLHPPFDCPPENSTAPKTARERRGSTLGPITLSPPLEKQVAPSFGALALRAQPPSGSALSQISPVHKLGDVRMEPAGGLQTPDVEV